MSTKLNPTAVKPTAEAPAESIYKHDDDAPVRVVFLRHGEEVASCEVNLLLHHRLSAAVGISGRSRSELIAEAFKTVTAPILKAEAKVDLCIPKPCTLHKNDLIILAWMMSGMEVTSLGDGEFEVQCCKCGSRRKVRTGEWTDAQSNENMECENGCNAA